MPNRIADYLKPNIRFARSVNVERDFANPKALEGYFVTEQVERLLERISVSFDKDSTERAWRITGDYGTGKSCFALALATLASRTSRQLPAPLKPFSQSVRQYRCLPILVTGSREPISASVIRGIVSALKSSGTSSRHAIFKKAKHALNGVSSTERDRLAIELLEDTADYSSKSKKGKGVLLVLDELGKGLEYATQNPDQQDILFLQTLAETASRSSGQPLVVLAILHQGFSAYADRMSPNDQREWDKIGGRFEELLFDQPLDQLIPLIASALGVETKRLPSTAKSKAKSLMEKAIKLGWFGSVPRPKALIDAAPSLYPIHPCLLPVLVRFFSRFGQNERSLFSFLHSSEPEGIRAFAEHYPTKSGFYSLHLLYDFAKSAFGHRLNTHSLNTRWNQINSVVEAGQSDYANEAEILKTVGLLNMLDSDSMLATADAIKLATTDSGLATKPTVSTAIKRLSEKRKVLYQRGSQGGYCLWPHTSVNVEIRYREAERRVGPVKDVVAAVMEQLEERPIVARRHYVETGNLRYFEVVYTRADQLKKKIKEWNSIKADGAVFVPLCRTKTERQALLKSISKLGLRNRPEILVAIPETIDGFAGFVNEIRRWEWVQINTSELSGDRFAREEVSRQVAAAKTVLKDRTNHVLNVRYFRDGQSMNWYHKGKSVTLGTARDLFARISKICDQNYPDSPLLLNELLNRRSLSSAAAAARMRLIERVLENATQEFLGMDPSKKPPEMSMYLSALQNSNVHFQGKDGWRLQIPSPNKDTCNFRPLFNRMRSLLQTQKGARFNVDELFVELNQRPVGAREGLLPLLFAVFCVAESQHVALYEDGGFVQDIDGAVFARLVKVPESFEIQYCKLTGVRSEVFSKLLKVVDTSIDDSRDPDLIDVVRPLVSFAATLPDYSRNTTQLSKTALAVRDALVNAEEPATLLFVELPKACGIPKIPSTRKMDAKVIQRYVRSLKKALGELRGLYPSLLDRIEQPLAKEFKTKLRGEKLRKKLAQHGRDIAVYISEPGLKAFALRLADDKLSHDMWLESLGSLVATKPPKRWYDQDEPKFCQLLIQLVIRFKETEALTFKEQRNKRRTSSFRITVLTSDGVEKSQIVDADLEAHVSTRLRVTKLISKLDNDELAVALALLTKAVAE